jgi:hypothetical protein
MGACLVGWQKAIGRFLVALALIVQIWAPVGSSAAMVQAAFDPLADALLCSHDQDAADGPISSVPLMAHHGDACGLCQLTAAGGHAPPPPTAQVVVPTEDARRVEWLLAEESVALARQLDHIRGRGPPLFS